MLYMKFMTSESEKAHEDPQSSTNAPQSAGSLSNPEQVIGIKSLVCILDLLLAVHAYLLWD